MGVAASSASANDVWLWACHGPNGQAMNSAQIKTHGEGGVTATKQNEGCDGATQGAGWRLAGTSSATAGGHAKLTVTLPSGLSAKAVKVGRTLAGFGGDTGYTLTANSKSLTTGDSATPIDITPANVVTLELRCSVECSGTPTADIASVALQVTDTTAPEGGPGWSSPVDKGMPVTAAFTDNFAIDRAVLSIDGFPALTQEMKFDEGKGCVELSPGNGTNDRPLDIAKCAPGKLRQGHQVDAPLQIDPATVTLTLDPTSIPENTYTRRLVVYDIAGNAKTVTSQVDVWHPVLPSPTQELRISTASVTEPPSTNPNNRGGSGGVQGAQRNQCRTPRLSVILRSKPVRVSKGTPVLKYKKKYRFTGRLTCVINGKRQSAPKRTKLAIRNKVGKKTVRKPNTAIRAKGRVDLKLAFVSSRTVIFRYANADGQKSEVKIKVRVTKKKK